MSARVPTMKLVVTTTLLNLIGNTVLWVSAVAYSISHGDNMRTVNVISGCKTIGYFIMVINVIVLLIMLFDAARLRKWSWLIVSILLLAFLACEALFIWGIYILALMAPMGS